MTAKQPVYYDDKIESFYLILHDLLGNEYKLPTRFDIVGENENVIEVKDAGFVCDINAEVCDEKF